MSLYDLGAEDADKQAVEDSHADPGKTYLDTWKLQRDAVAKKYGELETVDRKKVPRTPIDPTVAAIARYWDFQLQRDEVKAPMEALARGDRFTVPEEAIRVAAGYVLAYNREKQKYLDLDPVAVRQHGGPVPLTKRDLTADEALAYWRSIADMAGALDTMKITPTRWGMLKEAVLEAAEDVARKGEDFGWQLLKWAGIGAGIVGGGYILYSLVTRDRKVVVVTKEDEALA